MNNSIRRTLRDVATAILLVALFAKSTATARTSTPPVYPNSPARNTPEPGSRTARDVRDLASILYTEARDASRPAMTAIGFTVANRMRRNYERSVRGVWGAYGHDPLPGPGLAPFEARQRDQALAVAYDILVRHVPDPTSGGTHYYSPLTMPRDGEDVRDYDVSGGLENTPLRDSDQPRGTPAPVRPKGPTPVQTSAECPFMPPVTFPLVADALASSVGQRAHIMDTRHCDSNGCRAATELACTFEAMSRQRTVQRMVFLSRAAFDAHRRRMSEIVARIGVTHPEHIGLYCRMLGSVAGATNGDPTYDEKTRNATVSLAARLDRLRPGCKAEVLAAFPSGTTVQDALHRDWGNCLDALQLCPASFDPPLPNERHPR